VKIEGSIASLVAITAVVAVNIDTHPGLLCIACLTVLPKPHGRLNKTQYSLEFYLVYFFFDRYCPG
jgi:hypothetical protein